MNVLTIPIILSGPPGCGKSHFVQNYVKEHNMQLFICPCRRDRTLRDGRQKLHIWAKRAESAVIWLEGADDLTPEAQAFLRRVLETHSSRVQFILECRNPARLQEPIRSRCATHRIRRPEWNELETFIVGHNSNIDLVSIKKYLHPDEYSYRRIIQCSYIQRQFPDMWQSICNHHQREINLSHPEFSHIPEYIAQAYNPEYLLEPLLNNDVCLSDYGECIDKLGSTWALLASALYIDTTVAMTERE